MKGVIQCGGKGTRLRPYTMILPKPLMPVGSKPVLELLLTWLRRNGITEVYVTTGYLGHLIRTACGDGRQWGLKIDYTEEPEPLGTVGALRLLRDRLDETFLVINGDVLTDLNIAAFHAFHRRQGDLLTLAATRRTLDTDFGILEAAEGHVTRFQEKPKLTQLVSMGVYCMEPEILSYIPDGMPFGFDNLMACMMAAGKSVGCFNHDGTWFDIGRVDDFQRVQDHGWDERCSSFETRAVA